MPAKAKVTKEMIVDAAFAIASETGVENVSDESKESSKRRYAWNWDELYPLCH